MLALATRHPQAHNFQAFCIYITWQQVTEETIARHFQTGMKLSEAYLPRRMGKDPRHLAYISELLESFRAVWAWMRKMTSWWSSEGHAQGWRLTDGEKDLQLCSRKTLPPHYLGGVHKCDALYSALVNSRANVHTVRLDPSLAAASLNGLFDHPLTRRKTAILRMGSRLTFHQYASEKKWLKTTNIAHAFFSIEEISPGASRLGSGREGRPRHRNSA